jgi:predicted O-methyltransferase YrrM
MAGEGRERESLDNIACTSGYTDRIDLIGHTDQIPALMAIADVVLLPSLTEGLSRVILEAMVASRAVVATRVGGSAEVVKDGQTGFIVPARNTSDLADALRRILGDVSLSQRMGQAGRRRVETEFTQERYWDQLSAMYAELVGRKSRKSRRMNSMRFFKAIRFLRTPRFVFAWAREILEDRVITQRHRRHMDDIQTSSLPLAAGIARATAGSEERIDDLLNQSLPFLDRSPRPEDALEWGASSELARLCYTVARIITPEKIVETGIGAGVSSWANLLALHENHRGHLFSIDLPTPNSDRLQSIGYLVPDGLRERWSFALGSSRRHLPEVLRNAGQIDIFLHDSRHSYSNQRFEYRAAWPYLRPGGLLISDDVGNDAFYECAIEFGVAPIFISQAKAVPIGLMVKTT